MLCLTLTRSRNGSILTTTVTAAFGHGFSRTCPNYISEKMAKVNYTTPVESLSSHKEVRDARLDSSVGAGGLVQQLKSDERRNVPKPDGSLHLFDEMKKRFLSFKHHKYLKERDRFKNLAEVQSPKFLVIACVDSRVCPSNILGFQPGEAFMIRNVANIVPPLQNGPTETNAAIEFAINTLQVENIFVIGHSNCAGIQALMSMQDDNNSSFVEKWVATAKIAKLKTKTDASGLGFDQQSKHCEKESINHSLMNLLTYPWIEERMRNDKLSIHGGYYDFVTCTFEKWTLDFTAHQGLRFSIKDKELWC